MDAGQAQGVGIGVLVFYLAVYIFFGFCMMKVFQKAGKEPAWAAFVPIWNIIVLLQVAGRPVWWLILMLIPLVNFVIFLLLSMDVAERFGQSKIWGIILLFFFGIIGYPILAFGSASYSPPS